MPFKVPEQYRIKHGQYGSTSQAGNNGAFLIPLKQGTAHHNEANFQVVASDGEGWEHVSVGLPKRTPTWEEMCYIKDFFWDKEDCVVQYHPPEANYVNNAKFTLHLWRPVEAKFPAPEDVLVGVKGDDLFASVDDIIFASLGMLTLEEDRKRRDIANAMIKYGGSFVQYLGWALQVADRKNYYTLKRGFANYFEEYEQFLEKNPEPKTQQQKDK